MCILMSLSNLLSYSSCHQFVFAGALLPMKEELNCTTGVDGVQCVMTIGTCVTPTWCANSLVSVQLPKLSEMLTLDEGQVLFS